jgi:hypothetical protein
MSSVPEIEAAIERFSPSQIRELADWLTDRMLPGETPAMLAALDEGIRSLKSEPTVPAEDVRKKIKAWATGWRSRPTRTEAWRRSFASLLKRIRAQPSGWAMRWLMTHSHSQPCHGAGWLFSNARDIVESCSGRGS